jgi:predicted acylesterase/phospholipase RssA
MRIQQAVQQSSGSYLSQRWRATAIAALMVGTSACAINRPVDKLAEGCKLNPVEISVVITDDGAQSALLPNNQSGPVGAAIAANARAKASRQGITSELTHNLVLSGGGQHGSFGSGFLIGQQDANRLARYDVVTGVSTGALQATFALLGRDSAPGDRMLLVKDDFPADANRRPRTNIDDVVSGYTITREKTLYNKKGALGIIRGGAQGNLAPLSVRLDRLITRDTLSALKAANSEKPQRKLFVALLNYETGNTEIVDMTALAARFDGSNFDLIQHCYNQVLLAASSEPIGAPPVVIDRKLYFDAGLRYGVFLRQILRDATMTASATGRARPTVQTDVIVNGDLQVDPSGDTFTKKFSALDIAGRGRKILVNQVYRFSVSEVIKANSKTHSVRFAAIRPSESDPKAPISPTNAGRPVKDSVFDPVYMKRMIKIGRMRGANDDWQPLAELMAI